LNITNAGAGYTSSSTSISIASPGIGTRATATATVSGGQVTSFTISEAGAGYTSTQPPVVLIESPVVVREEIRVNSYTGDYGSVVGFGTTTVSSQQQLIFDFFIDTDSFMRDSNYVGTGITVSGISTGDFFTIYNSNLTVTPSLGDAVISQYNDGSNLGITTSFVDSTFQVNSTYTLEVDILGIGRTTVRRVFTNVGGISTISFGSTFITFDSESYTFDSRTVTVYQGGISSNFSFGEFSWGKIDFGTRIESDSFNSYNDGGYAGLSTGALVTRSQSLRYNNYT